MVNVAVLLPARFTDAGEYLADARALEEAGAHSLWLDGQGGPARLQVPMLLAALAAVTSRVRLGVLTSKRDQADGFADSMETLQRLSRSRAITGLVQRGEVVAGSQHVVRFVVVPVPANPAAWADSLQSAARQDAGVLVALFPELLDLLRRPDQADDRSDLILSQG